MQVLKKNFKNIYSALLYFICFTLLLILPSFLHMTVQLSHSNSFFVSLVLFFSIFYAKYKNDIILTNPSKICCLFVVLVFLHGIVSSFFIDTFDYSRFLLSLIYLIFMIFIAQTFYGVSQRINDVAFSWSASIMFYILLVLGFLSSYGFNISGAAGKPIFYFDEPSKFALVIIPLFTYRFVKSSNLERLLIAILTFKLALNLPSVTLFTFLISAPILFLKSRKFFTIYLVYFLILLSQFSSNKYNYFIMRLPFYHEAQYQKQIASPNSTKEEVAIDYDLNVLPLPISTCIPIGASRPPPVNYQGILNFQSRDTYYSGWLRGFYNLKSTYGFGLGFQQLGFRGCIDKFLIERWPLNLKDGGTVGAKILNEFGLFGAVFFVLYIIALKNKIKRIRNFVNYQKNNSNNYKNIIIFLDIAYISFFINLFVRGAGYFDASGFFFLISTFGLLQTIKLNFNTHEKL